ncbi:MAG: hypothetical protein M3319_11420 [Actinomycetota bacterium]|nr:hypothetical protein [Actinomycetota bacterium]
MDAVGELDVARATSNVRYTRRNEHEALAAKQAELGWPEATRAALIPITEAQVGGGWPRTAIC